MSLPLPRAGRGRGPAGGGPGGGGGSDEGLEGRAPVASMASEGFALPPPPRREGQVIPSSLLPSTTPQGGSHLVGGDMCLLPPQSPGPGSWWDGEEAAHLSLPGAQHKARLIKCGDL